MTHITKLTLTKLALALTLSTGMLATSISNVNAADNADELEDYSETGLLKMEVRALTEKNQMLEAALEGSGNEDAAQIRLMREQMVQKDQMIFALHREVTELKQQLFGRRGGQKPAATIQDDFEYSSSGSPSYGSEGALGGHEAVVDFSSLNAIAAGLPENRSEYSIKLAFPHKILADNEIDRLMSLLVVSGQKAADVIKAEHRKGGANAEAAKAAALDYNTINSYIDAIEAAYPDASSSS